MQKPERISLMHALDVGRENWEIQEILESRPEEVHETDDEGKYAIHYAAAGAELTALKLVFLADRDLVDAKDETGQTPLLCALITGRLENAEFLANNGANVNAIDENGRNAIHWTVVCGQLDSLNWAVNKGAEFNISDYTQKCTPLHYATCSEDVPPEVSQAIVITLLKHGANPNSLDADDRTPIHWCSSNGNLDAIKAISKSGGDLLCRDRDQLTILHCAASHGYHEVIEFGIRNAPKSIIDDIDTAGHTALFYAISFGHYEAALKLLQNNANPNHQDQRLATAAHSAASKGQMRMLKLLKQFNASFDIQNYRGDLPFHEAVQAGSKDVVEWLLAMDDSVLDIPNHNGRTALHLAASIGNLEMVILLCTRKCFVDPLCFRDNEIYTPLDLAVRQRHDVVAEYLKKLCRAKSSKDFSDDYIDNWRLNFEAMVSEAKRKRDEFIAKRKRDRRPSTGDRVNAEKRKEIADVGVNTTQRSVKSADSNNPKRKYSKSTSVTNLIEAPSIPKKELEALKESIENGQRLVDEDGDLHEIDLLDVDEEFENLPPISDLSESNSSFDSDNDAFERDDKSDDEQPRRVTVQDAKASVASSTKNNKESKKEVKIDSSKQRKKKSASKSHGTVVMRVRREPEIGSDGGDVDIYDDGEGRSSDDEEKHGESESTSSLSNRRYIHERAVFQELTHLKRMQIQYGKVLIARKNAKALFRNYYYPGSEQVQEKVLVRSLISNFCKMHSLDVRNFKFTTFYAWEKFLYDALSEQLKIIYLEERERLAEANGDVKLNGSMKLDKFDSKIRNSVPINDKFRDMQRIYKHTSISNKKTGKPRSNSSNASKSAAESSRKRITKPWY